MHSNFSSLTCMSCYQLPYIEITFYILILQDLERKLQSGLVLSNRMYLWSHREFDPELRKHYSEHFTLFSDIKVCTFSVYDLIHTYNLSLASIVV